MRFLFQIFLGMKPLWSVVFLNGGPTENTESAIFRLVIRQRSISEIRVSRNYRLPSMRLVVIESPRETLTLTKWGLACGM